MSWIEAALKWRIKDIPICIKLWNGRQIDFSKASTVTISLPDPLALRCLFYPTLPAIAEAYVEGKIGIEGQIKDIILVVEQLSSVTKRLRPISTKRWKPQKRSKRRDAEAVQFHYDVSNDFYRHWLDQQMLYSCAYFKTGTESINLAQEQKLDHICRKLMLKPGDRFLDIGCGWGGLIRWAVKNYGVKSVGITLSRNQYEHARQLICDEKLEDRCEVLLCDYRDLQLEKHFDKIASVGMFEHVGLENLGSYFNTIFRLLKDGGLVLNHGICSSELDHAYVGKDSAGDFIDRYVFPGSELPHINMLSREITRQNLELVDVESLRPHYAQTLKHWLERLENNREILEKIAGDKRFRTWRAYLGGSAYAFEQGWISVYQMLLVKRANLKGWPLPWTRDYVYQEYPSRRPV